MIVLLCAVCPSYGQKPVNPEALAPARFDLADLERAHKRALARRNVGIALAVPGVLTVILGSVLIGHGAAGSNLLSSAGEIAAGVIADVAGLALAIPGVVLWIGGQDQMDALRWRRQQMGAPPLASASRLGLSLSWRF